MTLNVSAFGLTTLRVFLLIIQNYAWLRFNDLDDFYSFVSSARVLIELPDWRNRTK